MEKLQAICEKNIPSSSSASGGSMVVKTLDEDSNEGNHFYSCHLCSFSSLNRDEFNLHVNGHYEFKCQKCDFMTKEEDEYR